MTQKPHSMAFRSPQKLGAAADIEQVLSRKANRICIQSIEGTSRKQNPSDLGQSYETTRQLRSRESEVQPQPTTEVVWRQRESNAISKFDMRSTFLVAG